MWIVLFPPALELALETSWSLAYHLHWIPQVIEIQYIRRGPTFGGHPGGGIVRATPLHGIHANWGCEID
jgi:hypothetical protein